MGCSAVRTAEMGGTDDGERDWDRDFERRLVRKLNLRIVLPVFLMMFIAYLDRNNMGNARVLNAGTPDSIEARWGLTGRQDYNLIIAIYGIGLFITEPWTNFILKYLSPPVWFARIMVTWGIIVMCQAAVTNFAGALACRFFLGVAEAGLMPGAPYYLAFWFTTRERGVRLGAMYAGSAAAGMVGGFVAMGVQYMNGVGGLLSWQWLFILEGIPAILFGGYVFFFLPPFPDSAKFLNDEEKYVATKRLPVNAPKESHKITWAEVKSELKDPVLWEFSLCMMTGVIPIAGASALLPSILYGIGFTTSVQANGLAAAVNGFVVITSFFFPWHSDYVRERFWHSFALIAAGSLCGLLPLGIAASNPGLMPAGVRLFLMFVVTLATPAFPILMAYRIDTGRGTGRSAVNLGMQLTFHAAGTVVGPFLFPNSDAPNYAPGLWTCFGMFAASIGFLCSIPLTLRWQESRLVAAAAAMGPEHADEVEDGAGADVKVKLPSEGPIPAGTEAVSGGDVAREVRGCARCG
ncbi:major facilitator superfamily domain-containing protein [Hyaloraphidium curvatum]|nr:major facilitator superfamily domain-containing protein [Hyaloraphidium curvatum]